jgi:glycosyltransferase involved in cell wall biosynthesis
VDLIRGLHELRRPGEIVVIGSRPEPVREIEHVFQGRGGWRYYSFPRSRKRGGFYIDQVRFNYLLWSQRIDLCHSLNVPVPMFAPCPVVVTQYDLMMELFPEYRAATRTRLYRVTRWAVRHLARRVICISRTTAGDLRRLWRIDPSRADVIPLGTYFNPVEGLGSNGSSHPADMPDPGSGPTIVSPYNLEARKNLTVLLEAVARLRVTEPQLKLVLFGRAGVTPEREEAFRKRVRVLGIEDATVLTGYIQDQQLASLYREATVFVFPSLYEGFGLPVLEAMKTGACVVVRDASAMAEIVGSAGVCVDTRDADQLTRCLEELFRSPERRRDLRQAARVRASLFTVERMARLTFDTYCRALSPETSADFQCQRWPGVIGSKPERRDPARLLN